MTQTTFKLTKVCDGVYQTGQFQIAKNRGYWSVIKLTGNYSHVVLTHWRTKKHSVLFLKAFIAGNTVDEAIKLADIPLIPSKKNIPTKTDIFKSITVDKSSNGYAKETNDCAVVAVSIATKTPYAEVYKIMQDCGRKTNAGTERQITYNTIAALGYEVEKSNKYNGFHQDYTDKVLYELNRTTITKISMNTNKEKIANILGDDTYLCFIRGHVFAYTKGELHDHQGHSKAPIIQILKLIKTT